MSPSRLVRAVCDTFSSPIAWDNGSRPAMPVITTDWAVYICQDVWPLVTYAYWNLEPGLHTLDEDGPLFDPHRARRSTSVSSVKPPNAPSWFLALRLTCVTSASSFSPDLASMGRVLLHTHQSTGALAWEFGCSGYILYWVRRNSSGVCVFCTLFVFFGNCLRMVIG
ncbi:hypothetical protein C8Q72DRAFT_654242 [Fomitopsis betulina]|nr:hypothetical protein C8Q72DRAFT_654242 [Fomitopsis betulina]